MSQKQDISYEVLVRCFTYNHRPYICDALNGFCSQMTKFPYVCAIVDDASTDGSPELIERFFLDNFEIGEKSIARKEETSDYRLLFARHKINKNCFFAIFFLKEKHYKKKDRLQYLAEWLRVTKYHALCEGDDYWTDEKKLQRQVDYLETHPECSAISENGIELFTESGKQQLFNDGPARFFSVEELIVKRRFPTASVLYRKDSLDKKYHLVKNKFDTMLWCFLASKGNFYYDAIVSSVYRRGPGVTVTTDPYKFAQMSEAWYRELQSNFPENLSMKEMKRIVIRSYIAAANRYIKRKTFSPNIFSCYKKGASISPSIFVSQMGRQYIVALQRKLLKKKKITY